LDNLSISTPREKLVIVVWSARSKPSGSNVINDEDFYAGVIKAPLQKRNVLVIVPLREL